MKMKSSIRTVDEICERLIDYRGKTPTKTESGVRLITAKVIKGGRIEASNSEYIAEDNYDEWMRRGLPKKGDVLVTTEAPLGEVAPVPDGERIALAQRVILLRPNPSICDPTYLLYAFQSAYVQGELTSRASGCTVTGIKNTELRKVRVPLPPMSQQRAIGNAMSAYDDLMENNRRRIALLEESARLLYREWFVRLRFPGYERTRITNEVPADWRKMPLGSITTKIGSGSTPRGGEAAYQTEGVTLIRSMNVYDDRFDDAGLAFIGEEQAAALDNVAVQARDILLNITGASVARCCMAPERYLPARVNQHVMIIRADPAKADPFFVHAAINSDERKRQLLSYAQKGSTREALTKETISAFELTLPSADLMRQFGEIAEPCFRQRETLALQNQKLRTARDHLLPRLMSGELAV